MVRGLGVVLVGTAVAAAGVRAQTGRSVSGADVASNATETRMPFAYVDGATVRSSGGGWGEGERVQAYARAHPGKYLVFLAKDGLHALNRPEQIAELDRMYAPTLPLEARQRELAAQQRPLAEQQKTLAAQQRAATGDPAAMGRIGAQQGKLGEQQGAIGRQQGEIGRQQGELGRAFHQKVEGLLQTCLADGSCPRVEGETAQR